MAKDAQHRSGQRRPSYGAGSSSNPHRNKKPYDSPNKRQGGGTRTASRKDEGAQGGWRKDHKQKPKAAKASLRQFAWIASAKKARHLEREKQAQEHAAAVAAAAASAKGKAKDTPTMTDDFKAKNGKSKGAPSSSARDHPPSPPPRSFKIVAGSYEKLLYGLEGTFSDPDSSEPSSSSRPIPTLKPIFIFPAHVGCVKAVSASPSGGKWLATSSTDEIIKVWDLRRKKEVGGLVHHTGSVTQLTFPSPSHLLSASEDGTLCLFSTKGWVALRTFKGHKGRINCVAVHPSGKLALSVGRDRTVRMWDFMRGKASLSTKIGKEAELVRWAPSGTLFAVQAASSVDIYTTNMTLISIIEHSARIQDIRFLPRVDDPSSEVLLVSAEDKKVSVYDAEAVDSATMEAGRTKEVEKGVEGAAVNEEEPTKAHRERKGGDNDENEDEDESEDESQAEPMEDVSQIRYRVVAEFVGHESRVKAMDTLRVSLPTAESTSGTTAATMTPTTTTYLTTISSDGKIHLYDCADIPSASASSSSSSSAAPPPSSSSQEATASGVTAIQPIATYDTKGSRLTCVAFADGEVPVLSLCGAGKGNGDPDRDEGDREGAVAGEDDSADDEGSDSSDGIDGDGDEMDGVEGEVEDAEEGEDELQNDDDWDGLA